MNSLLLRVNAGIQEQWPHLARVKPAFTTRTPRPEQEQWAILSASQSFLAFEQASSVRVSSLPESSDESSAFNTLVSYFYYLLVQDKANVKRKFTSLNLGCL